MTDVETPEPVETPDPVSETPDLSAEVEKWKALARKNEERAKSNADKAKRLDEIEEASKSELEKIQAQLADAQRAAADAEAARLRASIAAKHGVPEALLTGSTEEALEEAATALLAFKGVPPAAPSTDGQGALGAPISDQIQQITTIDQLNKMTPAEVNQARREGRLDALLGKP